ncbi:Acyl-CoA synthetase yngI [Pseudodesulfovibrio profundus]|uniref:Acyl-CoA synthetase yngI n=1 Tax=Pseudodesulfovibrio profundus TaxID=57320 RepID=A0A2C8FBX0_9BACT|nr:AMP-binding protein [Pseudodesulfovibrio profundus]SOB59935.1 Acyl-CoA synthetase yngI [Pseudodesulfovibrio profundus]
MNDQDMTLKSLLEATVERHGDRVALGFVGGEPITYTQFYEKVGELCALLASCGVGPKDKVAIISENMPNWAITYFAVTSMGAIAVPILQEFHSSAVHHILRHSEAKVVVASNRYIHKVEGDNFVSLKTVICMDDLSIVNDEEEVEPEEEPQSTSFTEAVEVAREKLEVLSSQARKMFDRRTDEETLKKVSEAVDSAREKLDELSEKARNLIDRKTGKAFDLTPDSVAAILYTSGTTGHSKGVVLTHRNLVSNTVAGIKTIPVFETDRFLSVLPMAHTYECTVGLIVPVYCGASVYYLQKPPTPKTLLPAMQKVKPTVMNVVPLIIEKIYKKRIKPKLNRKGVVGSLLKIGVARRKVSEIAGKKLVEAFGGELRCMCIGGAALAAEVEKFLSDAKFPYAIGYGMTETSPLLAGTRPGRQRLRGIGPQLPGVELRILDADPATGEGEIIAKGPNVMREYYKAPKDTEKTFTEDGWLLTGDLGIIDEDGYVFIKGRLKNVIIGPSGENIYPEEVESIINTHDFVMESLVYESDGKLVARIHLNYDALDEVFDVSKLIESDVREKVAGILEDVRKDVNSKVSSFARLARVKEQSEPFEKTPTQKIKRFIYLEK